MPAVASTLAIVRAAWACALALAPPTGDPWTPRDDPQWVAMQEVCYLDASAAWFRRVAMLASMTNPSNSYARHRASFYGHGDRGWDALPAWNPRSVEVGSDMTARLVAGDPLALPPNAPTLWDGARPHDPVSWRALGERVFWGYPLRADPYVAQMLRQPPLAERLGMRRDAMGTWVGVVAFADTDGQAKIGITCAFCHADVPGSAATRHDAAGQRNVVVGAARRTLDYGQIRLRFRAQTGAAIDPTLAARMATWGPGRADVTEDDDQDPVAIPDLWGLRYQVALTQAGTISHVGPVALAIRQETQYLHAGGQRTRPPRELAWALTQFLYAIEPPREAAPAVSTNQPAHSGAELFAAACQRCHASAIHGGGLVDAHLLGTNPALAFGTARGTGYYRVAPLVRVCDAAPYFHDGSVRSLRALLAPTRMPPGHAFGRNLAPAQRDALIKYLCTL